MKIFFLLYKWEFINKMKNDNPAIFSIVGLSFMNF